GHPRMSSFLGVPVLVGGQPVGNLYLAEKERADSFSEGDQQVVESFALHAGIAIQNARLHAQVQGLAVMEDRERIGKDLHDGIIQELYAVGLSLEDVPELLGDDPDEAGRRVERAIDRLHFTISDIRNFIFELQPDLLEAPTLVAGASQLVEEFRHNTAVEAELDVHDVAAEPPSAIVREILAILSEALSNVARHAHAHLATVEIAGGDDHLSLTITDDGIGLPDGGAGLLGHQGLRNMRSRADRLGASLELGAGPEGGTRVILRVGGEGRLS
ncbi:MAG TPA: GAF domain-containing sensor histidine kinase, partial [Candidatus Limnocylindrales bacterium]|nr:GAF domain-containing sensor histidine kinase [Candidatus Limnocylindrales bacterium]